MHNKLSLIFLEKKRFEAYTTAFRQDVMALEDVKIYGEIVRMEQLYNNGFWGYARPELEKLAQTHGIKEYKI